MIRKMAAITLAAAGLGSGLGHGPASAQDGYRWDTYTLSGGCTVTKSLWGTWRRIEGTWTWTGACQAGQPISGRGELMLLFPGSNRALSWTGAFNAGRFDGAYEVRELARGPGGFQLSAAGDTPARYTENYLDGCDVGSDGVDSLCASSRPGRGGGAPAPSLTGNASANRPDNAHNPANEASQCLELRTVYDSTVLYNLCSYTVEAVWCVEGHDCKDRDPGYSNTWSIQAGNHYTAFGARNGGQVQWAACKGANSILLVPEDGRWKHRCPDRLQPSR